MLGGYLGSRCGRLGLNGLEVDVGVQWGYLRGMDSLLYWGWGYVYQ